MRDVFPAVQAVADAGAKPVVMVCWNLVLRCGVDAFARDLAAAGGLGIITPNLIPDRGAEWRRLRTPTAWTVSISSHRRRRGAAGDDAGALPWVRLRIVDDGRHRCA